MQNHFRRASDRLSALHPLDPGARALDGEPHRADERRFIDAQGDLLAKKRSSLAALREQLGDARVRHLEVGITLFRPLWMAALLAMVVTAGVAAIGSGLVVWIVAGVSAAVLAAWAAVVIPTARWRPRGIDAEIVELERDITATRAAIGRLTERRAAPRPAHPRWPSSSAWPDVRASQH